jgi:phosphatidylglycerol:prolipoprotein diacylglycerol transferase
MHPFHVSLGPFAISPVEVFAVLGVALVGALCRPRTAALGVSWGRLFDLGLAALVGGAIGARLYYFVPLLLRGLEQPGNLVRRWSEGSGYMGGFIGGSLAIALLCRIRKHPVLPVLDAVAAPLPAGFAVGKLGCFFAGCCYGPPCAGFPGVRFATGSLAERTHGAPVRVHPTQLYEMALGLLLFAGLTALQRRSARKGEVYAAYVVGYSAWRFLIEFVRDDPGRHGFGSRGLSDSQIAAIVLCALGGAAWVAIRRRPAPQAPR